MQISIQGKGLDVGDSLRDHTQEELKKTATKYFSDAVEGRAHFSRGKTLFRADLSTHIGRDISVQSHGEAGDPYAAFDAALERMDKRLRRYHRRLRDHRRLLSEKETLRAQHYVLAPLPEETEETPGGGTDRSKTRQDEISGGEDSQDMPVIVAEMVSEVAELSVSEAVMRMDISDQPALLFRSRTSGRFNMVYRRSDGHIGWIDPNPEAIQSRS